MATQTFDSPGSNSFSIPPGVREVYLLIDGAQGGKGGGNGGRVTGVFPVSPSDFLYCVTAGAGGSNSSGYPNGGGGRSVSASFDTGSASATSGGGGGSSDVRHNSSNFSDLVALAGGGGGDAHASDDGFGDSDAGNGGHGGGNDGTDADSGQATADGGHAGASGGYNGGTGQQASSTGPDSASVAAAGGGGGGDDGGGGGNANSGIQTTTAAGGGGGGNSTAPQLNDTSFNTGGGGSGDGQVVIKYAPAPSDLSVVESDPGEIATLSWTPISGVDGFRIYHATSSGARDTADYTQVADIGGGNNSYDATTFDTAATNYWRVESYTNDEAPANLSDEVSEYMTYQGTRLVEGTAILPPGITQIRLGDGTVLWDG